MNNASLEIVKNKFASGAAIIERYIKSTAKMRSEGVPPKLFEAMEYSLTAGGKRLRPILCLATAERCGMSAELALPMALGLEMLHTATLIHDDLPCMDDDDMRRGKPSNHALYGETLAILAGDALLAQSIYFPLANLKDIPSENIIRAIQIFTEAIGPAGVCGGQVLDMFTDKSNAKPDSARTIAALKTGALIRAAVLTGAALGGCKNDIFKMYDDYATHLGAAFQIVDDILDATSTAEELGKTPGKDLEQSKLTHVTAYGLQRSKEMAVEESKAAAAALNEILPNDDFLILLPQYLVNRGR